MEQSKTNNSASFVGLRDWVTDHMRFIERLIIEHDRRYQERWESQQEAIRKAETAQNQYNSAHNDLLKENRKQSEEFQRKFETVYSRDEVDIRCTSLSKEISNVMIEVTSLREARSKNEGRSIEKSEVQQQSNWTIGNLVAVVIAIISLMTSIFIAFKVP